MKYRDIEKRRKYKREWMEKWRRTHPDIVKEQKRKYYQANREKCLKNSKAWRLKNPERFQKLHNEGNRRAWRELRDSVIRVIMKDRHGIINPTQEMIDLFRQTILFNRSLKRRKNAKA